MSLFYTINGVYIHVKGAGFKWGEEMKSLFYIENGDTVNIF